MNFLRGYQHFTKLLMPKPNNQMIRRLFFLEYAQPLRPGANLLMPMGEKYINKLKNVSFREGGMGRPFPSKFQIGRSVNIVK